MSAEGNFQSVSALASGGFVMSWLQNAGIYAQRFAADGAPIGSPAAVTTDVAENGVTGLTSGGYVVTWMLNGVVSGRVYDGSGTALGAAFVVDTDGGFYGDHHVFALPTGGFVVNWVHEGDHLSEQAYNVHAQRFDAAGAKVGSEIVVNDELTGFQSESSGVALASGRFVIVYTDQEGGTDDPDLAVRGQLFEADGTPVGDDFLVNTIVESSQSTPDIAALPGGGFVVAWLSYIPSDDIPGYFGAHAVKVQLFDANGAKVGDELLISTPGDAAHNVTVTALPWGGFLLAWQHLPAPGFNDPQLKAQLVDPEGNRIGGIFDPNTIAVDHGSRPDFATLTSGDVVATWRNDDFNADPEDVGLKTQILDMPTVGTTGDDLLVGTAGDDRLAGMGGADDIDGGAGIDVIDGGPGDDAIDGGAGADTMAGVAGNDIYIVDDAADAIEEAEGGGTDTVRSSVTYMLAAELEKLVLTGNAAIGGTGNALANTITGNGAANALDGGDGNDRLNGGAGEDAMAGGLGDDTFIVDDGDDAVAENAGEGFDTVESSASYRLSAHVEKLVLTGSLGIGGTGNGGANDLVGNGAANRLDGGAGADEMAGRGGNDLYLVDNQGDVVVELAGGGTDTVESRIDHVLDDHVERLILTGTAALSGTGNDLANLLTGNGAANVLNGGGGADTMKGGAGDDFYVVAGTGDSVVELAGQGTDSVRTLVSYTLPDHVEKLVLSGGAGIAGTGNALANLIIGNGAANRLDGAAGADSLAGGAGHDVYVVNNGGDQVIEAGSSGNDIVESSVSYTLPVHVEKLILTGSFGYDGQGNAAANTITGNSGGNFLNGGRGNDLIGGGAGNDRLMGNFGRDSLTGGSGDDRFYFNVAPGAGHADDILDFSVADDSLYLLRSAFTGTGPNGTLAASAFHQGAAAADAADRILHDAATGNLFYDADGTGAAAPLLFATVDAGTPLTHADFIIYG